MVDELGIPTYGNEPSTNGTKDMRKSFNGLDFGKNQTADIGVT